MKILALIPARGGSKGVPGKNKKRICGKPLIEYTIEEALDSKLIDEIWVSTDDEELISIAKRYENIKVHIRETDLATDTSPIIDTILAVLMASEREWDVVVLLQPTSPIKNGHQIDEAIKMMKSNPEANSVISVCAMNDVHPSRMYWKEGNSLEPIIPEAEEKRRQEIKPAYFRNGAIYVARTSAILRERKVMTKPSIAYEMPSSQLLNIDEPRDILIAETLINAWKNGQLK
ncbi:MAG TPA: acylneuraminate cytidylyltransferase family protein [Bacteroidales bacterium]|nr:acylneuraminate cytidylyltransferase family protein [Bacteroidales bacterium]